MALPNGDDHLYASCNLESGQEFCSYVPVRAGGRTQERGEKREGGA